MKMDGCLICAISHIFIQFFCLLLILLEVNQSVTLLNQLKNLSSGIRNIALTLLGSKDNPHPLFGTMGRKYDEELLRIIWRVALLEALGMTI